MTHATNRKGKKLGSIHVFFLAKKIPLNFGSNMCFSPSFSSLFREVEHAPPPPKPSSIGLPIRI